MSWTIQCAIVSVRVLLQSCSVTNNPKALSGAQRWSFVFCWWTRISGRLALPPSPGSSGGVQVPPHLHSQSQLKDQQHPHCVLMVEIGSCKGQKHRGLLGPELRRPGHFHPLQVIWPRSLASAGGRHSFPPWKATVEWEDEGKDKLGLSYPVEDFSDLIRGLGRG